MRRSTISKACLFACLFLCISVNGFSQALKFPKHLEQAYDRAVHYKFSSWPLVELDTLEDEDLPYAIYINSLGATLSRVITSEDPAKSIREDWENLLADQDDDLAAVSFVRAELSFHQSLVHFMEGEGFKSFLEFRKAYRRANDSNQYGSPKTSATLKIALGSIPENYQWIFNLLGYEGDPGGGLQELTELIETDDSTELAFESLIIKLLFQQYLFDQDTFEDWMSLRLEYPESPLVQFLFNMVALKNHQSQAVITWQVDSHIDQVYGQLGEAYLNKLEFDSAIYFFDEYEDNLAGNATSELLQKIWLCNTLTGDSSTAKKYRAMLIEKDSNVTEADANALDNLSITNPSAAELIKVRLTTDGGYYDLADSILSNIDSSSITEDKVRIELVYRKARLEHLTENIDTAIEGYNFVLEHSPRSGWYFAPNSAYQLGRIYQERRMNELAISNFEKVRDYRNYPYKSSLNNKSDLNIRLIKSIN